MIDAVINTASNTAILGVPRKFLVSMSGQVEYDTADELTAMPDGDTNGVCIVNSDPWAAISCLCAR